MLAVVTLAAVALSFALALMSRGSSTSGARDPVVRYRFRPDPHAALLEQQIAFLEKKQLTASLGAADLADLGKLYIGEAKRTGDLKWYDQAEGVAHQSLSAMKTSNPHAKMVLAQVEESRHQFPRAIDLADEVLREKPSHLGALSVLITSNLALGNLAEASHSAERLVNARPDLSAYSQRALVMAALGRNEEAVFDFRTGLSVEDFGEAQESAFVRALLARTYLRHGNLTAADEAAREALRIIPDYPLALDLVGQVQEQTGDFQTATRSFDQAFTQSRQLLYLIHEARAASHGDTPALGPQLWAQAEALARSEVKNNQYGHRLDLCRILLDAAPSAERAKEAVDLARQEIELRQNAEVYFVLARALLQSGELVAARRAIQEALLSGAQEAEYFSVAAQIEKKLSNPSRANFYLKRAAETNPLGSE